MPMGCHWQPARVPRTYGAFIAYIARSLNLWAFGCFWPQGSGLRSIYLLESRVSIDM